MRNNEKYKYPRFSLKDIKEKMEFSNDKTISSVVEIPLEEAIEMGEDWFIDEIKMKLAGTSYLTNVEYRITGYEYDTQSEYAKMTGYKNVLLIRANADITDDTMRLVDIFEGE